MGFPLGRTVVAEVAPAQWHRARRVLGLLARASHRPARKAALKQF
jgi:hypothetical protein